MASDPTGDAVDTAMHEGVILLLDGIRQNQTHKIMNAKNALEALSGVVGIRDYIRRNAPAQEIPDAD